MSTPTPGMPTDQAPPPASPTAEERLWGMLAHLLAIFTAFIGPLVIWLLQKDKMPFVDDQGKEALNFQISVLLYSLVGIPLIPLCGIGVLVIIGIRVFAIVMSIIAAVRANAGEAYRYPLCLRLVK